MPAAFWVIAAMVVVPLVLLLQFRWNWYPLQYLFFLRFPIIAAALLFFSPLAAVKIDFCARALQPVGFYNLFVLEDFGLVLVPFLAILASWTIVNAGRWLFAHTPDRIRLTLWGYKEAAACLKTADACTDIGGKLYRKTGSRCDEIHLYAPRWMHELNTEAGLRGFAVYSLLAVPPVACIAWASEPTWWHLFLVSGGILLAFLAREVVNALVDLSLPSSLVVRLGSFVSQPGKLFGRLLDRIANWPAYRDLETFLVGRLGGRADNKISPSEADEKSLDVTNDNLWRFFIITFAVYAVLGVLLWPGHDREYLLKAQDLVPALAYILILLMLVTWILSWFSLQLDGYRVPVEITVVLVAALIYRLPFTDTDHYYDVHSAPDRPVVTPAQYLSEWSRHRPGASPIVVAGSGGGISASAWVATVLAGLQTLFPDGFAQSIALVSTTSGGSVGAMYYVDGFTDGGSGPPHPPSDLDWVVQMASRSSLGAMGWGLVYPDFARLLFPLLAYGSDRGWALERRWAQPMPNDPNRRRLDRTIRDWGEGVAAGWRPAQVFNATFTETGGRFLIAPIAVRERPRDATQQPTEQRPWQAKDFVHLYPKTDIDVVTAARLSATFPWVTPVARPDLDAKDLQPMAYHVADGGYFDNFGVMSAIEFIREVRAARGLQDRRVLVLEIRSGDSTSSKEALAGEGFRMETIGPAETLMAVRNTSQLERNDLGLQMLRESAGSEVFEEPVVFELRMDSPLSWHLSAEESRRICAYWIARCEHNQRGVERIARFLGRDPVAMPQTGDPGKLCTEKDTQVPSSFDCPWLPDEPSPR